jgi:hypothetical protein
MDMTTEQEVAGRFVVGTAVESGRFDRTSIALHWLTVLFIITQFCQRVVA